MQPFYFALNLFTDYFSKHAPTRNQNYVKKTFIIITEFAPKGIEEFCCRSNHRTAIDGSGLRNRVGFVSSFQKIDSSDGTFLSLTETRVKLQLDSQHKSKKIRQKIQIQRVKLNDPMLGH